VTESQKNTVTESHSEKHYWGRLQERHSNS